MSSADCQHVRAIAMLLLAFVAGCGGQTTATKSDKAGSSAPVLETPIKPAVPPSKRILFQPVFVWKGGEPSFQGTGFFVKAPNGKLAAVTSAHFLNRDGPALLEAKWLEIPSSREAARFTKSWGPPGHRGSPQDLRPDYLLLPAPEGTSAEIALELDNRVQPQEKERIWFPDKDDSQEKGYRQIAGTVVQSSPQFSTVILDEEIRLQSQSGSPFISQVTGKVIGTLSRANQAEAKPRLLLTPAKGILDALANDREYPLLSSVIGKQ